MKKVIRIGAFVCIFIICLMFLENIFFSKRGILTVWDNIQNGEEQIDVLFMGNSHVYTALDTKCMSEALNKNIYVLGSGSQNMEMTYETLKYILKHKKPEIIILEIYSPVIDSREELQTTRIGNMMRYFDGVDNYLHKAELVAKTYRWNSIPEGIFQLMRPTNTWTRWNFSYTKADSDDTHGYNALETYSACEITIEEMENISRELYEEGKAKELVDYNKESLEKFLSLTKENGIDVWFFNAPTAVKATNSSMKIFEEICAQYDHVKYCDNMALEMIEMGLTEEDFYDEGHLNRRGAEKFTQYYSEILGERIWGITPEWDKAFGYKTESVTELENGQYCYEMINYSNDCLYMFELRKDGSLVDRQDYSEDNTYICSEDIRFSEEYELYCAMIPASDKELENGSPSRIKIPFLKLNASVID